MFVWMQNDDHELYYGIEQGDEEYEDVEDLTSRRV